MDIQGRTVWQHAAGDTDRDYAEVCLNWDVILNGPGHLGSWPECEEALKVEGWSSRKLTDIRRFAVEMKDGDLVVLRIGTSTVLGVGQIVGDYSWRDDFGDIDGWDLQHLRRVRWLWKGLDKPKHFKTYDLKQGDTTQKLNDGNVKDWILDLPIDPQAMSRELVDLPNVDSLQDIDVSKISEFLFDKGVASSSISTLLNEIGELTRIAKWYKRAQKPSEHETVAYLVVPLLRALGWTPQRMAIEWNRVDVALFEQLPRDNKTLRVVVEAKKMGDSCLSAMSQALSYSEGKKACHRLIVTDGLRYGIYTRVGDEPYRLYAYLNLTRLKHHYSIYGCHGAEEALLAMTPEWEPSI
jgi:hypothetical protein